MCFTELLIHKCSRLQYVWGNDAEQWRPERFIEGFDGTKKINLGVIANMYEGIVVL